MVNKLCRNFYNTILSQAFSPCGNYLVVGDIYGTVYVFYLARLLNQEISVTKEDQLPKSSFVVKDNVQINSLLTTDLYLIVGTVNEITGYSWKSIKQNKKFTYSWRIEIPNTKDTFDKPEVNSLAIGEENIIYVGCGNNVYIVDTEAQRITKTLTGHKDYIHCVKYLANKLVSGGEDGVVNLWDIRGGFVINKIEPHSRSKVTRPDLGRWIGGVEINDDWLLCGGGPRLSLWHLRTMNVSTVFPIEDRGIHITEIYQDKIFAGGSSPLFYQMSFNGDIVTEIATSAVTTYSAVHQCEPFQTLCLAGSSPKIDMCSNFIYKNLQLSLY